MLRPDDPSNKEAISKINWEQVNENILEGKSLFDKTNKQTLLNLILKVTGIKFNDIKVFNRKLFDSDTLEPIRFETDRVRPELGVCTRWIDDFQFELYAREPITYTFEKETLVYLSFCPNLTYTHISGGNGGFNTNSWFYYNCKMNTWNLDL